MRAALLALAVLAACGPLPPPPPVAGVVSRLTFTPEHDESYSTTCLNMDGKLVSCTKQQTVDDAWTIVVATEQDRFVVLDVTKAQYDACRLGARWEEGRCLG